MSTLRELFDALLVDLDGTVYAGPAPIPGAVDALGTSKQRVLYVTNNASRSPGDVAGHLRELGLPAEDADVVTSAQASAGLLAEQLPAGSPVLVVGTEALAAEIRLRGLVPVREHAAEPAAVVQGHSTETGWAVLAEATLAIRGGAVWVAANLDPTLPSDRGLLPGNGSMVAVLRSATDTEPQVAGKPAPPIMRDAVARADAERPLVIGDRLDTDIAGGRAAELPTLLVMTGVSTALDVLRADSSERPDYLAGDLTALDRPAADATIGPVEGWTARVDGDTLVVACDDPDADPWDGLRAACPVAWESTGITAVTAEGPGAEAALRAWGITPA